MDPLIQRAREGDASALVAAWYPRVYGLVRRMVGGDDEARETCQDVFARVLAALPRYRETGGLAAWIFAIATNVVRDRIRAERRTRPLSEAAEEAISFDASREEVLARDEDRDLIRAAFDRLPGDDRLLILQVFQQGLPRHDIAQALGISLNALRIRLHRALNVLRRCVQEEKARTR